MTPEERMMLDAIVASILDVMAKERGVAKDHLSLGLTRLVTRKVFEAFRVGQGSKRPSSIGFPAVRDDED